MNNEQWAKFREIALPIAAGFGLYHWSPTSNRKQIKRYGLRVGVKSMDGLWRPPYVCFAPDAELAWELSGVNHPHVKSWDLWQTYSDRPQGVVEALLDHYPDTGREYIKEYRIYERIYKRDLWYVGTRS